VKKKILIPLVIVAVILVVWWLLPRPPAQDEAMQAGKSVEDFAQAPDEPDLLAGTDDAIAMDAAGVRGRNTWWLWTAGNQAFWDWLADNSFGTFDLLKIISSYPCSPEQGARARKYEARLDAGKGDHPAGAYGESGYAAPPGPKYGYGTKERGLYADYACADDMYPKSGDPPYRYYDRSTRFCYTGLINEPGFRKPSQPDKYGLCLDQRTGEDPLFPGASEKERKRLEKIYGRSSGVLGLRLFPNPNFDDKAERKWKKAMEEDRYYLDPKFYADRSLVRPYRVGMSCGFCHISYHPLNPPHDPEHPDWENLSGTIGAQYFWFGRIFAPNIAADNFIWQLVGAQKPGSVDTSFLPHDNLFNPRAMNAIFELPARLEIAEKIGTETAVDGALDLPELKPYMAEDGKSATYRTPHVLWGGADSVTIGPALTRVYINIGEYHQQWIRTIDPLVGLRKQSPIRVKDAQENSVFWNATQERVEDMAAYLIAAGHRYPLEDAPHSERFLRGDRSDGEYRRILDRGKVVFAENCARCHSSKLPEPIKALSEPGCIGPSYLACWKRYWEWTETEDFKRRMTKIVQADDFLENNYLSTDARIPVHQPLIDFKPTGINPGASTEERYLEAERQRGLATGALEGEICSAMASNAIKGHVWNDFSSESYKSLPSVGTIDLYNPITDEVFQWQAPGGGRGYQRVPSLVSVWSTAPYLHNNELGEFTGDPSVAGRMAAFDDAIRKLLWPERRANKIPRTSQVSYLKVEPSALPGWIRAVLPLRHLFGLGYLVNDEGQVQIGPFPGPNKAGKGTPIGLVGNLNLARTDADFGLLGLLGTGLKAAKDFKRIERENLSPEQTTELLRGLVPDLIDKSACPDFIVDRGHYFGTDLPDADKEALIEFIKTL
jgi:hypothetical protein